ncbi:MAG: DUF1573 domain-containing protein [Planctomycetaceae bacterium]
MLTTVQRICAGLAVLLAASAAHAQNYRWAQDMFAKQDHDFGVVARGAEARYRIEITNLYKQTIHISGVRKTCGCTEAKVSKETLATYEKAYLEIAMDTKKFTHEKTSTVTVMIDQPVYAEVTIPIKAYIRTDVVLTPGGVQFGGITRGADAEQRIDVAYAGRQNWAIRNVVSKNPAVVGRVVETRRAGGRVNYDLFVTVKGAAPAGEIRELLTLMTDDAGNPQIPVLVEARVENEYSVTPELVDFGTLRPGDRKTMNVVVRGKKPFAIEKVESEKSADIFEVRLPQESRPLHVVPLTMVAPADPGSLSEEFNIRISGSDEPVVFRVSGKIAAAPATGQTADNSAGRTTAQKNP